jgi:hypothetical protein
VKARCKCCSVNRRWKDLLYSNPDLWGHLDLSNRNTLGGEKFYSLINTAEDINKRLLSILLTKNSRHDYNFMRQYSDDDSQLSADSDILQLSHYPNPRSSGIQKPLFPTIFRFSRIYKLDLSCTIINLVMLSNPAIHSILAPTLTHLYISGCPMVDSGSLIHLAHLTNLQNLDVSHCENVDDTGLEVLSVFVPWLKSLNASYLFKLTESGVRRLFRMPNLETINLMGCCRIKTYAWAVSGDNPKAVSSIREISTGEDSRIQTRGFWLLWCTWQNWDMEKMVNICPHLEVAFFYFLLSLFSSSSPKTYNNL